MSESLTRAAANLAANGFPHPLPQAAIDIVRTGLTDLVACMIAGREEPVVDIVKRYALDRAVGGSSSVCFTDVFCSSELAALVNGTATHALDYDDVGLIAHPSTVLAPAVLAEGERLEASGKEVITAYLVGYEVWSELAHRDRDPYHQKGWHPTSVLGVIGATAAICALGKHDVNTATNAIGLAASMASGLSGNFGTMAKPLQAGRAAAGGISATALAAGGMTATPDVLEHPAGLLAALSPNGRVERGAPSGKFGLELSILSNGLSYKKYPNCYATHRVVDGVLDLAQKHDLAGSNIERVKVQIGPTQASILRNHRPQTALEAKFSLEFAVAAALTARRVSLGELTDEFVGRADVQDIVRRVEISIVDTQCPVEPAFAYADRVRIACKDGREFDSDEIRFARGHARMPMPEENLRQKFESCCLQTSFPSIGDLWDKLAHLDTLDSIRQLSAR